MAMIMVIIITSVMLLVPIALAQGVVGQLPLVRHDQDFTAAMAAAESGVDDYQNRLNADASYWQSSLPSGAATRPAPVDGNKALTGWVPVSPVAPHEFYCYTVDQSLSGGKWVFNPAVTQEQGIVDLTVYGYSTAGHTPPVGTASSDPNPCNGQVPSGGVERVVSVALRQVGFLDYLEMTDLNLVDQAWYDQDRQNGQPSVSDCYNDPSSGHYAWYWKGLPSDCANLENYWGTGNLLNGPVRSNDDYYLCGTPVFQDQVISDDPTGTAGNTGGRSWVDPAGSCGTDNPVFDNQPWLATPKGTITANPSLIVFPKVDSTSDVLAAAQATGAQYGCYYSGPTDIVLNGDGTMAVTSPLSSTTNQPGCFGAHAAVPPDGVIYVDNGTGAAANCSAKFGTGLNWALAGLPVGDVCNSTTAPGDVFIQGSNVDDNGVGLSVISADNIFITGDITESTAAGSPDVLGLIADNYVEIEHPVSGSANVYGTETFYGTTKLNAPADWNTPACNNNSSAPDCDVKVDAAVLSLSHSLGIQNYGFGAPFGTLQIDGALAQEYMDIEGTFASSCNYTTQHVATNLCSGMNSVYSYDSRLAHLTPPHFLDPSYSQWRKLSFEECPQTGCQS